MRKTLLSLMILAAPALAGDAVLRGPVEVPAIGFKAALNDGRVISSWRRYKRDDFVSYRVVKSATDADPVYPAIPAAYSSTNQGDVSFEDGFLTPGTWHYRLCILTRYGDRWVSPVATVVVTAEQAKRSVPTDADFEP